MGALAIGFIIFFITFLFILFVMHFFVISTVVNSFKLFASYGSRKKIIISCISVFIAVIGLFYRIHGSYLIYQLSTIWFGVFCIGFSVFIVRLLFIVFSKQRGAEITAIALIATTLISIYSIWNASGQPLLKEVVIFSDKLPLGMNKFKIVLLSDLQLTRFDSLEWLSGIVKTVNSLSPDIIFVLGDVTDDSFEELEQHSAILGRLKSGYPILAVTGNHEYYSGLDNYKKIAEQNKWEILSNRSTSTARFLEVVGIDDKEAKSYSDYGGLLKGLTADVDRKKLLVLLSHRPEPFSKALELGFDLMFAGHIHAGQIPPMDIIVQMVVKYPYGLYKVGKQFIYTTSGASTWGPPMRFLSQSEIVLVSLQKRKVD